MNKKTKALLSLFLLAIICFVGIYFDNNFFIEKAFASEWEYGGDTISNFVAILEIFVQFFYILTRPIITIAWATLSNEFVYWSVFFLDDTLWMFWNMMKNFANYIIGFVFLAAIFFYIINYKQEKFNPKSLLPKFLIAAVWVQASWFIIAALIDLSTILTYSVWWLPLQVLDNFQENEEALMMPVMSMDISEEWFEWLKNFDRNLFYTNPGKNDVFPVCKTDEDEIDTEWLENIEWPDEEIFTWDLNLNTDCCVFKNKLVWAEWNWIEDRQGLIESWEDCCNPAEDDDCHSIKEYTDTLKGFTWPLYTLFGSLLNISDMWISWVGWSWADVGAYSILAIMKIIIFLALLIPLLTLAVILIIRWVLIWLIVALAPILAISWSFGFNLWEKAEKLSIWSVLWLIFLPVTAAFAVSISIIFLTVLNNTLDMDTDWAQGWEKWLGINVQSESLETDDDEDEKEQQTCFWVPFGEDKETQMCFTAPGESLGISPFLDIFGWIIVNLFGIALMWAVIFAALKTSKLTVWVVNWVDNMSKEAMKTAPVIPTPWWGQSIGSLEKWAQDFAAAPATVQSRQYQDGGLHDFAESMQSWLSGDASKKRKELEQFKWVEIDGWGRDFSWFHWKAAESVVSWRNIQSVEGDVINKLGELDDKFKGISSLMDIAKDPELRQMYNTQFASTWQNIDDLIAETKKRYDQEEGNFEWDGVNWIHLQKRKAHRKLYKELERKAAGPKNIGWYHIFRHDDSDMLYIFSWDDEQRSLDREIKLTDNADEINDFLNNTFTKLDNNEEIDLKNLLDIYEVEIETDDDNNTVNKIKITSYE